MSHTDDARDLIDMLADAIDSEDGKAQQYLVGRDLIQSYFLTHPKDVAVISAGIRYLDARLGLTGPAMEIP